MDDSLNINQWFVIKTHFCVGCFELQSADKTTLMKSQYLARLNKITCFVQRELIRKPNINQVLKLLENETCFLVNSLLKVPDRNCKSPLFTKRIILSTFGKYFYIFLLCNIQCVIHFKTFEISPITFQCLIYNWLTYITVVVAKIILYWWRHL